MFHPQFLSTIKLTALGMFLAYPLAIFAACDNTVAHTTPSESFTNNRDGTITDDTTGLMWTLCIYPQTGVDCTLATAWVGTWDNALQELDSTINYAPGYMGYTDWRVPNVKELASILETQCTSPALNTDIFPLASAGTAQVWSSSPDMADAQNVWVVDFFANGGVSSVDRTLGSLHLRLVRDDNSGYTPPPY